MQRELPTFSFRRRQHERRSSVHRGTQHDKLLLQDLPHTHTFWCSHWSIRLWKESRYNASSIVCSPIWRSFYVRNYKIVNLHNNYGDIKKLYYSIISATRLVTTMLLMNSWDHCVTRNNTASSRNWVLHLEE